MKLRNLVNNCIAVIGLCFLLTSPYPVISQTEKVYNMMNVEWVEDIWMQVQLVEKSNIDSSFESLTTYITLSKAIDSAETEVDYVFNLTYYYSNPPSHPYWEKIKSIEEKGMLESLEIFLEFSDTLISEKAGNYWNHIETNVESFIDRETSKSHGGHADFDWYSNSTENVNITEWTSWGTHIWYRTPITNSNVEENGEINPRLQLPLEVIILSTIAILSVFIFLGRKKLRSIIFGIED